MKSGSRYDGDISESNSESVAVIPCKKYLNNMADAIKQATCERETHPGIKPQPAYYQLNDAKRDLWKRKTYQGKHWDLGVGNDMERSIKRLTVHAIDKEVVQEQLRRIGEEEEVKKKAEKLLTPLHKEFQEVLSFSKKLMEVEEASAKNKQCTIKDEVQAQLLRVKKLQKMVEETEEERQEQITLLRTMITNTCKSSSAMDLADAMATTNQKKSIVHTDLQEAFAKVWEDEEDTNMDYKMALTEMMDESLIKMCLRSNGKIARHKFEVEKLERVQSQYNGLTDKVQKKAVKKFQNVLGEMLNAFDVVHKTEEKKEKEFHEKVVDMKNAVQEEMIRRVAAKWTREACAIEKTRRIMDDENKIAEKHPSLDAMRNVVSRVQRQLIVQKFQGKLVNRTRSPDQKPEDTPDKAGESEQDRKLRRLRTMTRQQSNVVRKDED